MEGVDPNGLASGGSMDNRSAARPGHRSLIAIGWLVVGAADQDAAPCAGPRNQLLFR
jgi:hypothetical protein